MARKSKVNVQIEVDTKSGKASVIGLEKEIKGLGKTTKQTGETGSSSFMGMSKGLLGVTAAFGALTIAATKAFAELRQVTRTQDEIAKLSKRFGIATEELSAYRLATELTGTSMESLSTGLRRAAANALDASRGIGEAKESFDEMGIEVTDATGKLKNGSQLLSEVANKFQFMSDATKKAAIAQDIFGRSGSELVPLLNEGADGIEKMKDRAEELGIVFDEQTAAKAERFNDAMTELKFASEGLAFALADEVIPALTELTEWLTKAVSATRKWLSETKAVMAMIASGGNLGAYMEALADLGIAMADIEVKTIDLHKSHASLTKILEEETQKQLAAAEAARKHAAELKKLNELMAQTSLKELYGDVPVPSLTATGLGVPGMNQAAMQELAELQKQEKIGENPFSGFSDISGTSELPSSPGMPEGNFLIPPDDVLQAEMARLAEFAEEFNYHTDEMLAKGEMISGLLGDAFRQLGAGILEGGAAAVKALAQVGVKILAQIGQHLIGQGVAEIILGSAPPPFGPRPDLIAHGKIMTLIGAGLSVGAGAAGAALGGGSAGGPGGVAFGGGGTMPEFVQPTDFEIEQIGFSQGESGFLGSGIQTSLDRNTEALNSLSSIPPGHLITKQRRIVAKSAFGESPI